MRQIGDMGSWHMEFMDWQDVIRIQLTFFLGLQTVTDGIPLGMVTVPFWVYWTSPKILAIIDLIYLMDPNGWVMFNGDI